MRMLLLLVVSFLWCSCTEQTESTLDAELPAYSNPLVKPYTEALKAQPGAVDILLERSQALMRINQPALAVKDLEAVIKADSLNPDLKVMAADIYLMLEKPRRAIPLLKNALEQDSGKVEWQLLLSRAFLLNDEQDDARLIADRVLEQYPNYADAFLWKGVVEWAAGNRQEAIGWAEKALQLDPGFRKALLRLGDWSAAEGDDKAVSFYRRAFVLDSSDVAPLYAIAQYYEAGTGPEQAKTAYRECIYQDPDYSTAYFRIGQLLQEQDSFDAAIRHYRMAIKTKPDYAAAYLELSHTLESKGETELARQARQQAQRLAPDDSPGG